jgi:hypothetical protein
LRQWTYDIYGAFVRKGASDSHYVRVGRWSTLIGVLISIGTAHLVMQFLSIMDYVQALFSFFIAPLFGTVLLGMLWKRATPAAGFWGLLAGTLSSVGMWPWVKLNPTALGIIALSPNAKDMAENQLTSRRTFPSRADAEENRDAEQHGPTLGQDAWIHLRLSATERHHAALERARVKTRSR